MEETKKTTKPKKGGNRWGKKIIVIVIICALIGTITIISTNPTNWLTTEIVKIKNDKMPTTITEITQETNYCVVTVNLINGTNVKYYVSSNPQIVICNFTGYSQNENILYLKGENITGLNKEEIISCIEFGTNVAEETTTE